MWKAQHTRITMTHDATGRKKISGLFIHIYHASNIDIIFYADYFGTKRRKLSPCWYASSFELDCKYSPSSGVKNEM